LLPPGGATKLALVDQKTLASGIVVLAYSVPGGIPAPPIRFVKASKKATKKATTKEASRKPAAQKASRTERRNRQ
jgi:hypothetical protein